MIIELDYIIGLYFTVYSVPFAVQIKAYRLKQIKDKSLTLQTGAQPSSKDIKNK